MATKVFDLATAEALITGTTTVSCPKCGESNWTKAPPGKQTKKPGFLTIRCKTCHSKASSVCKKERYATDEACRSAQKASSLAWQKDNPGKCNAKNAKYRAAKLQATPPWSETDLIQAFYEACPEGMHVDHYYPLSSPTDENGDEIGCGLHVLKNLQYLTAAENISKGNKWPESLVDWVYS